MLRIQTNIVRDLKNNDHSYTTKNREKRDYTNDCKTVALQSQKNKKLSKNNIETRNFLKNNVFSQPIQLFKLVVAS